MDKEISMDSVPTPGDKAFGKPVVELCNHPEYLTDGNEWYGGNDWNRPGYLGTHWPAFVTVDLLKVEKIEAICFKLWDWEDPCNRDPKKGESREMQYAYRLLISSDRHNWTVLYDCADSTVQPKFRKGWQCFHFPQTPLRYIRVHALKNRKNSGFHIVKLKAFADGNNDFFQKLIHNNHCLECSGGSGTKEIGDGTPLSFRLLNLAGQIQEICSACSQRISYFHEQKASEDSRGEYSFFIRALTELQEANGDLVAQLFKRGHEVQIVSEGIDETRSLISRPVQVESQKEGLEKKRGFLTDFFFGMFQFGVVSAMYFADGEKTVGYICLGAALVAMVVFAISYFRKEHDLSSPKQQEENLSPAILAIRDSSGNCLKRAQDGHCFAIDSWGNIHGFSEDGRVETIWASKAHFAGDAPKRVEEDKTEKPFATIEYPRQDGEKYGIQEILNDEFGGSYVFDLFEIEHRGAASFDTCGAQRRAVLDSIAYGKKKDGSILRLGKEKFIRLMGLRNLSLLPFFKNNQTDIYYNERIGFHSVPVPGWIEFDFGKKESVRYIRFLLWDNAGAGKKQRSHRMYNYRVLFRADETAPWIVLHDTMGHGSCGWQEFINAGGEWTIRFVRIYGVSNSGSSGSNLLQLVRLGMSRKINHDDLQYAIRNRIVKYEGQGTNDVGLIPDIMQIVGWMRNRAATKKDGVSGTASDETLAEWKKAGDALLLDSGRTGSTDNSPNDDLLNLVKNVSSFAGHLVSEHLSWDSSEDFSQDVRKLVTETLAPFRYELRRQERFEICMRWPKTILVATAALPMAFDCIGKWMANPVEKYWLLPVAAATLAIGSILIFAIWRTKADKTPTKTS